MSAAGQEAWRKEEVSLMRQLWNEDGLSAMAIVSVLRARLGTVRSRAAILGYMSRNRDAFPMRRAVTAPAPRRPRERRAPVEVLTVTMALAPPRPDPLAVMPHAYDAASLHLKLEDMERDQCRFPVNDADVKAGEPHLFCGHAAHDGPYCAHHAARAFAGTSRLNVPAVNWRFR